MGLADNLPRVALGRFPTPLEAAPRLTAALGGPTILIKREDLSGLAVGGSKTRIFEFVLGDAKSQGATAIVAMAGEQSNKLRELAAGANRLGMKPILLLNGINGPPHLVGNRFLFELLGAEIHTTAIADRLDPAIKTELQKLCDAAAARGERPYMVYHPERTGTIGTAAYVSAAEELSAQFDAMSVLPNHLFIATGAAPTTAGLVLGLRTLGRTLAVTGVSVGSPAAQTIEAVTTYANRAAQMLGLAQRISPSDFTIVGDYVAPDPSLPAPRAIIEAIELFARTEGILLEPTYTGKAAAGLIAAVQRGALTKADTVVFVHTGGLPGLFAHSSEFGYQP